MLTRLRRRLQLPDEIVLEILEPFLRISEKDFCYVPDPVQFEWANSSSSVITVSKQFCRVGTPLLYHTVVLRSKSQSAAFSKALVADKSKRLCSYVRKLRIESALGIAVRNVFKCTSNLDHLFLGLHYNAADSVTALVNALPTIPLRHLSISAKGDVYNKPTRSVLEKIVKCIEQSSVWPLETISLTQNIIRIPGALFLGSALGLAKMLSQVEIVCAADWPPFDSDKFATAFSSSPCIKEIVIQSIHLSRFSEPPVALPSWVETLPAHIKSKYHIKYDDGSWYHARAPPLPDFLEDLLEFLESATSD